MTFPRLIKCSLAPKIDIVNTCHVVFCKAAIIAVYSWYKSASSRVKICTQRLKFDRRMFGKQN